MTRSESAGLAVAIVAHAGLFLWLSLAFLTPPLAVPTEQPIEVSLTDEVGLQSQAPTPNQEKLAARLSPVEAPVEPDAPPPEPDNKPEPAKPKPKAPPPKPAPVPDTHPPQQQASADNAPRRRPDRPVAPTGNLDGILTGASNNHTDSRATTPPAAVAGPSVVAALQAEIIRQIKPHWKPPSGADSDKLRTTVTVQLDRDGSIIGEPQVTTTGITPSNSAQAALHKERAIRAVKLAAPFNLPAQYYDAWKKIAPTLFEDL